MRIAISKTPQEKFDDWFARPLSTLATLKDGDGAFIAFGTALALYERFIKAKLKKNGQNGSPENFRKEASADLKVDQKEFTVWWEIFRDGINHQSSPKKVKKEGILYAWDFSDAYPAIPKREGDCFRVNPWGFVGIVIAKYRADSSALIESDTYSLGDIGIEIE